MKESEVIMFLRSIWNNCKNGGWLGLNQAMYVGLHLAIEAGYKFECEDFVSISENFRFGYWGGMEQGVNGFAESFYSAACIGKRHGVEGRKNTSAAISFELYKKRPAFLYKGKRLAIGSEFDWWAGIPAELKKEELLEAMRELNTFAVVVTSFGDSDYLNAGFYKEPQYERTPGKGPDRRFKITLEELKRVNKVFKL